MRGLMRRVGSGERGFTLIELLVVIAILGIIAAVVVLNIGSFLGKGAVEAANTEAHQVQTAVIAYMTENPLSANTEVGPESVDGPALFLLNPGTLQATYTIDANGKITGATPEVDGKWKGLTFKADKGLWE